jgi:ribosome-associated protein
VGTLDAPIRLALARSEQVAVAQFGATRARADERVARSALLPQVFASASYDRTLASEFSGLFSRDASTPACDPFTARPTAPLSDRVAEIERAIDCGAVGGAFSGVSFDNLPFGRENIYRFGLSVSQQVYTGGRVKAQRALAAIGRETADLEVTSARAQAVLEATEAFYDAALSDRLVAIAEAIEQGLQKSRVRPASVEGLSNSQWVLIDFIDVVAHVFLEEVRAYYDLEGLWMDAPRLAVPESSARSAGCRSTRSPR